MKLNETLVLPALLWAKSAATENENHRIGALEFGELSTLRGVIGKLVIRKTAPGTMSDRI